MMMKGKRKINMFNHVKIEDNDDANVLFWSDKTPAERLCQVARLRRNYFIKADVTFPTKMEKVVRRVKLSIKSPRKTAT